VAKKPVTLTLKEHEALADCRKVMAGAKPPENLATWARKHGYANQWAALRRKRVIIKKGFGAYDIADVPIEGEEQKAPKKVAKEKGKETARTDRIVKMATEIQLQRVHTAVAFFKAHPDLLDDLILKEAEEHKELLTRLGWGIVVVGGEIHLIEKK